MGILDNSSFYSFTTFFPTLQQRKLLREHKGHTRLWPLLVKSYLSGELKITVGNDSVASKNDLLMLRSYQLIVCR